MSLPCGYDKRGKAFSYALCRDLREAAAGRADALVTRYDDAVPLRDRNPWTSVQELFRKLQDATTTPPASGQALPQALPLRIVAESFHRVA